MTKLRQWIEWLSGPELAVLLGFVAIASGIWIFMAIAGEVNEGDTQSFDRKVLLSMRRSSDLTPLGPPAFQEAARDVTALGGTAVLSLLTLITAGFLLLDGKRHLSFFVLGSVVSGVLMSNLLKSMFQRARPDIVPHADLVFTTSFPSGHSMLSAVAYLTMGALLARAHKRRSVKIYFIATGLVLTFVVGLSRVYLGVHWPTDVLAGWTAGASWAILCSLIARKLQRQHALEDEDEHLD